MLTNSCLVSLKNHFITHIDHCEYVANGKIYKAKIRDAAISGGKVIITALLNEPEISGTVTITKVMLYGTDSSIWLSKAENISREGSSEGVLYRFTFSIEESD